MGCLLYTGGFLAVAVLVMAGILLCSGAHTLMVVGLACAGLGGWRWSCSCGPVRWRDRGPSRPPTAGAWRRPAVASGIGTDAAAQDAEAAFTAIFYPFFRSTAAPPD